jgi:hypothetical protein
VPSDALPVRSEFLLLLERPEPPTLVDVWRAMSKAERVRALFLVLWDPTAPVGAKARIDVGVEIARSMRRKSVMELPLRTRAAIASTLEPRRLPVDVALRVLHLGDRRPLLRAFLDALGVAHQNGSIADPPNLGGDATGVARVSAAVAALAGRRRTVSAVAPCA